MALPKERAELLDRAWTEAADLYLTELVPRFDPWFQTGLQELKRYDLPPGPIIVPCCGPGQELLPLHQLYGGQRRVVGLDLSHGMIDLARQAIAAAPAAAPTPGGAAATVGKTVEAHVADATQLDPYAPAAAVVSVFGMQQMGTLAPQALANWARCLAPGGVAVVVLWPSRVESSGPWQVFDQILLEKAAADKGQPPPAPDAAAAVPPAEWEQRLTEAAVAGVEGVELMTDRLQEHTMEWESGQRFWQVMTEGGPWRARRLAQGEAVMADLAERFAAKYGSQYGSRLAHTPAARIIVLRRRRPSEGAMGQPPASSL